MPRQGPSAALALALAKLWLVERSPDRPEPRSCGAGAGRRAARTVLVLTAVGSAALVPATPAASSTGAEAPAAVVGACTDDTGVTVVVDFPEPAETGTGCAAWPVTDGLNALSTAGFDVTPVQQFPAAVCRIDGVPADSQCVAMPPSTAYWSYWNAERGGGWTFAGVGATSHRPEPGSVEGWAFGAGAEPDLSPGDVAALASVASAPAATDPATAADVSPASGGVPVGTAVGAAVVVALGGLAWLTARNRRGRTG